MTAAYAGRKGITTPEMVVCWPYTLKKCVSTASDKLGYQFNFINKDDTLQITFFPRISVTELVKRSGSLYPSCANSGFSERNTLSLGILSYCY